MYKQLAIDLFNYLQFLKFKYLSFNERVGAKVLKALHLVCILK